MLKLLIPSPLPLGLDTKCMQCMSPFCSGQVVAIWLSRGCSACVASVA